MVGREGVCFRPSRPRNLATHGGGDPLKLNRNLGGDGG